jgi:hypothetical protein
MTTANVIAEVENPEFYNRVAFIAIKVAQNVASEDPETANHDNRIHYCNRIFTSSESPRMLAAHVVSSNPTIYGTVDTEGGAAVPDGDIEFALASIWDARANAFASGAQYGVTP